MKPTEPRMKVVVVKDTLEAYHLKCGHCGTELKNNLRFTSSYRVGKFGVWCNGCCRVTYFDIIDNETGE